MSTDPATPQPPRKRLVLSWIAFLTFMAAAWVAGYYGGPMIIVAAILFLISGLILGVQALMPGAFPKRRILPASYGLTNRPVPASRAYGTRFDRIVRAIAALVLLYVGYSSLRDALNP
jgi:hypothetical protein